VNGLILFEDEHLLVVNKPSGVNTHKPDRFAPDGIHEWLTKREPRWRNLSVLHRLDKDTSGAMLFGKTPEANQSLARQFEQRTVEKTYLLLSAARPTRSRFCAKSPGAATEFEFIQPHGNGFLVKARPLTGKTHQIRRHAADNGFPILGDTEYGGGPAPRLMLHAHKLVVEHPASKSRVTFEASVPRAFDEIDPVVAAAEFRDLVFGDETNAFRLISGAADGFPNVNVDFYGGNLLVQWQTEPSPEDRSGLLRQLRDRCAPQAVFEQLVTKQTRRAPRCVWQSAVGRCGDFRTGDSEAPAEGSGPTTRHFPIQEMGLTFLVGFGEGLSTGIFLDQRENRRRLLMMPLAGMRVLNTFAYTCAFSVAAARAGAATTSVDLSKNYLEWGKQNFRTNSLECGGSTPPSEDGKALSSQRTPKHEFLSGDVFEWLKRFAKRGRQWDVVILDPPTFSTTKRGRAFQAARDYEELATLAMPLVAAGGWLLCSTNQRTLEADEFEKSIQSAARGGGRVIESLEFETLPFDFRVAPGERPYLKTFWARLG
jgi:23S rRNA (cytosine1962-C5)-methyltransferase